jgi:hypothetical protein
MDRKLAADDALPLRRRIWKAVRRRVLSQSRNFGRDYFHSLVSFSLPSTKVAIDYNAFKNRLFLSSLVQPQKYYQVRILHTSRHYASNHQVGFSQSRSRYGTRSWFDLRPNRKYRCSSLQATKGSCHWRRA